MEKLLHVISEYKHWLIWLTLQILSMCLFLNDGLYRRSILMWGTGTVFAHIQELSSRVYGYLNLREENEKLLSEYGQLEHSYLTLLQVIEEMKAQGTILPEIYQDSLSSARYEEVVTARVLNLSKKMGDVYVVINKGRADGVDKDMPVLSSGGVVGSVLEVSEHSAVVMPIVNRKMELSCMVKHKGYQGILLAGKLGERFTLLGLSSQAKVVIGDTILTSGYSFIFPRGLQVGIVDSIAGDSQSASDIYYIRSFTDFDNLRYVYVLPQIISQDARMLDETFIAHE